MDRSISCTRSGWPGTLRSNSRRPGGSISRATRELLKGHPVRQHGTGLSDRVLGAPDFDMRAVDLRAVLDAAGSERAVIVGNRGGGSLAAFFAARCTPTGSSLSSSTTLGHGQRGRRTTPSGPQQMTWQPGEARSPRTGAQPDSRSDSSVASHRPVPTTWNGFGGKRDLFDTSIARRGAHLRRVRARDRRLKSRAHGAGAHARPVALRGCTSAFR